MIRLIAVLSLLALAACGADGDPFVPSAPPPGLSVTGQVTVGVTV